MPVGLTPAREGGHLAPTRVVRRLLALLICSACVVAMLSLPARVAAAPDPAETCLQLYEKLVPAYKTTRVLTAAELDDLIGCHRSVVANPPNNVLLYRAHVNLSQLHTLQGNSAAAYGSLLAAAVTKATKVEGLPPQKDLDAFQRASDAIRARKTQVTFAGTVSGGLLVDGVVFQPGDWRPGYLTPGRHVVEWTDAKPGSTNTACLQTVDVAGASMSVTLVCSPPVCLPSPEPEPEAECPPVPECPRCEDCVPCPKWPEPVKNEMSLRKAVLPAAAVLGLGALTTGILAAVEHDRTNDRVSDQEAASAAGDAPSAIRASERAYAASGRRDAYLGVAIGAGSLGVVALGLYLVLPSKETTQVDVAVHPRGATFRARF